MAGTIHPLKGRMTKGRTNRCVLPIHQILTGSKKSQLNQESFCKKQLRFRAHQRLLILRNFLRIVLLLQPRKKMKQGRGAYQGGHVKRADRRGSSRLNVNVCKISSNEHKRSKRKSTIPLCQHLGKLLDNFDLERLLVLVLFFFMFSLLFRIHRKRQFSFCYCTFMFVCLWIAIHGIIVYLCNLISSHSLSPKV